jgi:hypothetical protein
MSSVDILTTISNKKNMLFQVEVLRRSLVKYSNLNFNFHVVIVTDRPIGNWIPHFDKDFFDEIKSKNYTLAKNSFIWKSECHWLNHLPVRWNVPFSCEKIIFIDADTIVVDDLKSIVDSLFEDLAGVPTYSRNITLKIWKDHLNGEKMSVQEWMNFVRSRKHNLQTSITKEFIPACFNFGFLIFNKKRFEEIKDIFSDNVNYFTRLNFNHDQKKFTAQLALTSTIFQLNLNFKKLDLLYNLPDYDSCLNDFKNAKVMHYLSSRNLIEDYFLNMPNLNSYRKKLVDHFLEFYPKIL